MEDYYTLLNLKPQSSNYRIARKYKERMQELLYSESSTDVQESILRISRAYSVLGNEAGRKYYDILYGSEISGKGMKLNESTIRKYTEVVDMLSDEGAEIVKKHLDERDGRINRNLRKTLINLYLKKGLFRSIGIANIILTGFGGIVYSLFAIFYFIKLIINYEMLYLIAVLILSFLGITILTISYRKFAISEMREILKN